MSITFSDDFAGLAAGVSANGRPLNNALGGGVSAVWEASMVGVAGTGNELACPPASVNTNNYINYAGIANAGVRALKVRYKRNGGRNASCFVARATSRAQAAASGFWLSFNNGHTSMLLSSRTATAQTLVTTPMSSVSAEEFFVTFDVFHDGEKWNLTAQLLDVADESVLLQSTWSGNPTQSNLHLGEWGGFGFYFSTSPQVATWDDASWNDMKTGAVPELTSPIGVATGRTSANGSVSSSILNGSLFYALTATGTPLSEPEIRAQRRQAVSASNPQAVSWSGLAADTVYYPQYMQESAGRQVSAVVVGASFRTDAALSPPIIESVEVVTPVIGRDVQVMMTPAIGSGPIDSVSFVLVPAAGSPGGAVEQGPAPGALVGGVWRALFEEVPSGRYTVIATALNSDNPGVQMDGDDVLIATVTGSPEIPEIQPSEDTEPPVMHGEVSITSLSSTSYTSACSPATDNISVTGYRVSQDGGTTWIGKGTSRTHTATGRTPGSTDEVWWSARDPAGNWADPITRDVTLPELVERPVMVGELTFSNVTATGYRVSWEPALNEPTEYSYTLNAFPGTPWTSVGLALYVDITGRPPGILDSITVNALNSAGGAYIQLNGTVQLQDQPPLPPGPGGKIVGISSAQLFRLLAAAADS